MLHEQVICHLRETSMSGQTEKPKPCNPGEHEGGDASFPKTHPTFLPQGPDLLKRNKQTNKKYLALRHLNLSAGKTVFRVKSLPNQILLPHVEICGKEFMHKAVK